MVRTLTRLGGSLGTVAAALGMLVACGPAGTRSSTTEDAWKALKPDDLGKVIYETRYGSGGMSSDPPTHEAVIATTGAPSTVMADAATAITDQGYELVGAACTPGATCRFQHEGDAGLVTVRLSLIPPHSSTEVRGQHVTVGDTGPALRLAVMNGG